MIRVKKVSEEKCVRIRHNLSYDAKTGEITRKGKRKGNGTVNRDGYLVYKVCGESFLAHRLAWFLYYGKFPDVELDHINRDRKDNRICNLRLADRYLNSQNCDRKPNAQTGVIGVYEDTYTKFLKKKYTLRYHGKLYRFYTIEDAVSFRLSKGLFV